MITLSLAVIDVSLAGIVSTILGLLIGAVVLGLLWFLIGYIEKQGWGPPLAFQVIRVIFVILVVVLLISLLMALIGHPLIRLQ
jgi:Na+/melibiose symporter-like transporter